MIRLFIALFIGKLIFFLSRNLKLGGGSAAPGYYALKIDPNLVSKLTPQIPQNITITGTNGKTTTARLLDFLVKGEKIKVIRNSTGSNLERGIASALIEKSNLWGEIQNVDLGIWELDEAAFNKVVFKIKPEIMVFLNAYRDQLDRYGEVDTVVNNWKEVLENVDWETNLVVNGGDNHTASLLKLEKFNISEFRIKSIKSFQEKEVEKGEIKHKDDFLAQITKEGGLDGTSFEISYRGGELKVMLPIAGVYNVYNFLAAFSCYFLLNLPIKQFDLSSFEPAFGRVEEVKIKGKEGVIMLIKNPAGATYVFETIVDEIKPNDRLLTILNDNFADGTDVSWIWDAKWEVLTKNKDLKVIVSGTRAFDLAVRLKYAGFENLQVETDFNQALSEAVKETEKRVFILPTYTALLELQKMLAQMGVKSAYWKKD